MGWVDAGRGWPGRCVETLPFPSFARRHGQPVGQPKGNLWLTDPGAQELPSPVGFCAGPGGLAKGPGHTQASPSRWHYSIWHSHSSGSWLGQCRHICVWRVSGRKPTRKSIAVCILRSSGHDSASAGTRQSTSVLLPALGKSARAQSTHRAQAELPPC